MPVMPEPRPVPEGVDPDHWWRLRTADALIMQTGDIAEPSARNRVVVTRHVRATLVDLLRPVCGNHDRRTDDLIAAALRTNEPVTDAWQRLTAEWSMADRLFHAKITVPETGDELTVTERGDGWFQVGVMEGGNRDPATRYAEAILPPTLMAQLTTRYATHTSPVTP